MAKISYRLRSAILALCYCVTPFKAAMAEEADTYLGPKVPAPEAIKAFEKYWQEFDRYDQKSFKSSISEYNKDAAALEQKSQEALKQSLTEQHQYLSEAAAKYRKFILEHPENENLPWVYLNITQILQQLAMIEDQQGGKNANTFREDGLAYLDSLHKQFPEFAAKEESLYLQGLLLSGTGRTEAALRVWSKLTQVAKRSIYSLHASLAVGDEAFQREKLDEAREAYERALAVARKLPENQREYEALRVQYRLAWVEYRDGSLTKAVNYAIQVLTPGRLSHSRQRLEKMQADAVDILADALYENDQVAFSKTTLKRTELTIFGGAVALRLMDNYLAAGGVAKAQEIGELAKDRFAVTKQAPQILERLAKVYQDRQMPEKRLDALERLALLLPEQSLWRTRYRDDFTATKAMEEKAAWAALTCANEYYEKGLQTGSVPAYAQAASFYKLIVQFQPHNDQANDLRLKIAHSSYFSDKLADAEEQYQYLRDNQKLNDAQTKVVAYQLVMTREREWRGVLAQAIQEKKDLTQDATVIDRLRKLESSVEEYAAKYPNSGEIGSSRTVDLLLVAAAANRDMENYVQAQKYWDRALASEPTPPQRAIAIRGIVLAAVKSQNNALIIDTTRKFIELEKTHPNDSTLSQELKGVLAQGLRRESDQLSQKGEVLAAGLLLLNTCSHVQNMPDWETLYRDGAFYLGIAGQWSQAQKAAQTYIDGDYREHLDDILYLKGRSQEYQMRFEPAAQTYVQLGESYPGYEKTLVSLGRAEKLASADENWALAGKAAVLQAKLQPDNQQKMNALERASQAFAKADQPKKSLEAAQQRQSIAKDDNDKLVAQLALAKAQMDAGLDEQALKTYGQIASRTDNARDDLEPKTYEGLKGESNFYLAEEERSAFEDFDMIERQGDLRGNFAEKLKRFEKMALLYDKSASSSDPEWSARSRFALGEMAEKFALDITAATRSERKDISPGLRGEFDDAQKRLQAIAKKSFGTNLLQANRSPRLYRDNVWVKKSSIKLTGLTGSKADQDIEPIPAAIGDSTIQSWSVE